MKNYLLLVFISISFSTYSQDSFRKLTRNGEKAFKSGDFVTASLKSSQALLQKSNFKRAIVLFENATKVVYSTNELKIEQLKTDAIPYKNYQSVATVNEIIRVYTRLQQVRKAASILNKVNFKSIKSPLEYGRDYTADITVSKQLLEKYNFLAAEELYVLGVNQFSQARTKEQFLEASNNLKKVKDFATNYKDALALEQEAFGIYNEMSAAQFYNEGLQIYNNAQSKKDYQRAYYVFIEIENFLSNYKDTNELIRISRDKGTFRVAFVPISRGQQFAPILNELYNNTKQHANRMAFVEVIDVNVGGVSNVEVLVRYLKSNMGEKKIDHLYKFTMDDFNVFVENDKVIITQEKTRKVKRNKVETTISGSFSKIKASSRALSNAFLEVIHFESLRTVALVDLSENIFESNNYWIFNEGDIDAFSNWKHLVPLVTDEERFVIDLTNAAAARIRDTMNGRIRQKQLELYN